MPVVVGPMDPYIAKVYGHNNININNSNSGNHVIKLNEFVEGRTSTPVNTPPLLEEVPLANTNKVFQNASPAELIPFTSSHRIGKLRKTIPLETMRRRVNKFRRLGYTMKHKKSSNAIIAPYTTARQLVDVLMADKKIPAEFNNKEIRKVLAELVAILWEDDENNTSIETLIKSIKSPCSRGFAIKNMKLYLQQMKDARASEEPFEEGKDIWDAFQTLCENPKTEKRELDAWFVENTSMDGGTNAAFNKAWMLRNVATIIAVGYLENEKDTLVLNRDNVVIGVKAGVLDRHKDTCGAISSLRPELFFDNFIRPMMGGRRRTRRSRK